MDSTSHTTAAPCIRLVEDDRPSHAAVTRALTRAVCAAGPAFSEGDAFPVTPDPSGSAAFERIGWTVGWTIDATLVLIATPLNPLWDAIVRRRFPALAILAGAPGPMEMATMTDTGSVATLEPANWNTDRIKSAGGRVYLS